MHNHVIHYLATVNFGDGNPTETATVTLWEFTSPSYRWMRGSKFQMANKAIIIVLLALVSSKIARRLKIYDYDRLRWNKYNPDNATGYVYLALIFASCILIMTFF